MKIAFYAPLKDPDHPVPSGDRQMARLLIAALGEAGHEVRIASRLRAYLPDSSTAALAALEAKANAEAQRIADGWRQAGKPDLWFCYHPYYRSPDLLGPALAQDFAIPYVTAEASHSPRRDRESWAQAAVVAAVRQARVNICFTERDRAGLAGVAPEASFAMLAPFIDTKPFADVQAASHGNRLVTVAMMRKGDKFESFRMLAAALENIVDLLWTLSVIGGGPLRAEVAALFEALPAQRIEWLGEVVPERVPDFLAKGGVYVWPGCGEAYGLAYLEAQAAGLSVVAQNTAGVPAVVQNGVTGLLTPPGDIGAFAAAVRKLLTADGLRRKLAAQARRYVHAERSLPQAAIRLATILERSL
jgi:glycosyltransferase involved in cell wall biosynthesis